MATTAATSAAVSTGNGGLRELPPPLSTAIITATTTANHSPLDVALSLTVGHDPPSLFSSSSATEEEEMGGE